MLLRCTFSDDTFSTDLRLEVSGKSPAHICQESLQHQAVARGVADPSCAKILTSAGASIPRPRQLSREQGPARLTGLAALSAGTNALGSCNSCLLSRQNRWQNKALSG